LYNNFLKITKAIKLTYKLFVMSKVFPADAIEIRKKERYDNRKNDVLDDRLKNGPLENRSC